MRICITLLVFAMLPPAMSELHVDLVLDALRSTDRVSAFDGRIEAALLAPKESLISELIVGVLAREEEWRAGARR